MLRMLPATGCSCPPEGWQSLPGSKKCADDDNDSGDTMDDEDEERFPIPELGDDESRDVVIEAEDRDFLHARPKFIQVDWDQVHSVPPPPADQDPVPTSQPQEAELTLLVPVLLTTPKNKKKRLDSDRTPTPARTVRSHRHKLYKSKDDDDSSRVRGTRGRSRARQHDLASLPSRDNSRVRGSSPLSPLSSVPDWSGHPQTVVPILFPPNANLPTANSFFLDAYHSYLLYMADSIK